MTPPSKKQAGGGKWLGENNYERMTEKEWEGCGESILQLNYDDEDKEEGELTDMKEDRSRKDQEWWSQRGSDKGGEV